MLKLFCRILPLLACGMAVAASGTAPDPAQLQALLDDKGAVWSLSPDSFLTPDRRLFFRWLATDKKDEAHYPGYGNSPKMTFLDLAVTEASVRFKDGQLGSFTLSLYNRGDQGDASEARFLALLTDIGTRITTWSRDKGTEARKTRIADKDKFRRAWINGPYALVLTWSASGWSKRDFRAEYIQLEITPFDARNDPRKMLTAPTGGKPIVAHAKSTIENVLRKENGDVYLDGVPMVDQGQKGYCAAATTERVLRFYGIDVSEHVIAELADSDAGRGTSAELMLKMIKRAGVKFGVQVREHYTAVGSMHDLEAMVIRYNHVAKREKANKVTLPSFGVIDLSMVYESFDPAVYKKYRCEGEKVDFKRFLFDVRDHIDKGIPLCWGVYLGLAPEEKLLPQTTGAHLRLIIGYNDTTSEMIYSDSWGAGHEFKKMSYADAWTITTGLYSFDPRHQQ